MLNKPNLSLRSIFMVFSNFFKKYYFVYQKAYSGFWTLWIQDSKSNLDPDSIIAVSTFQTIKFRCIPDSVTWVETMVLSKMAYYSQRL